jgi:hypothetical protein
LPGTPIFYSLTKKADKVSLAILDIEGKTVRELSASTSPGLHSVNWNLTMQPQQQVGISRPVPTGPAGAPPQPGADRPAGADRPQGFARGGGRGGFGRPVPAGSYRIVLTVDGKEYQQSLRVEGEPAPFIGGFAEDDEDEEMDP